MLNDEDGVPGGWDELHPEEYEVGLGLVDSCVIEEERI
jgi:hypothetical protein